MLIWVGIAAVAVVALVPVAWATWSGGRLRGRRDMALALHRAQLAELDRDLAENRLLPAEHVAARLEVQRRLLAEADEAEAGTRRSGPLTLVVTAALVPALALILYFADGGTPDYRARADAAAAQLADAARNSAMTRDMQIVQDLRLRLGTMDPHSEKTWRGYVMLGNAELQLGHLPEAADAWRSALKIRFDPSLGAETAEAITEVDARVTPEAAALFKRALAEAPADVPWRKDAEKRLAEAGGS
jgi:cytochrome c-type biogenesis protein CcmH